MSHVDEGILHAYLDGALGDDAERRDVEQHLAACATCGDALAEARRLRGRAADILAADILGGGVATVDVPPFEQVVRRRSRGPGGRLRRLRLVGLAATLALAVGVAWYARDGWRPGDAAPIETTERVAPERPGAADAPEPAPAADGFGSASKATQPPAGAGPEPRRQEADRTALVDAPADSAVRVGREADEERAAESRFPPDRLVLEPVVVTAAPAQNTADDDRSRDSIGRIAQRRSAVAAAPAESLGLRLRGGISSSALGTDWIAVSLDTAAAHLGRQPALVPDLPVIAYGIRRGDAARRLRVIQSLGDGMVIELIESRLADEAAGPMARRADDDWRRIASFLPDSAATVRIEREGYEIIGRANLPAESLRVLVERIR